MQVRVLDFENNVPGHFYDYHDGDVEGYVDGATVGS